MSMRRIAVAIAFVTMVVAFCKSRFGSRLSPPQGWRASPRSMLERVAVELEATHAKIGHVRAGEVDEFLCYTQDHGYIVSIAMASALGRVDLEEAHQGAGNAIVSSYADVGVATTIVQTELKEFGGRRALLVVCDVDLRGTQRQWHVMIPGPERTDTIVCTAYGKLFDKYEPVFETVISGLKPDPWPLRLLFRLAAAVLILAVASALFPLGGRGAARA